MTLGILIVSVLALLAWIAFKGRGRFHPPPAAMPTAPARAPADPAIDVARLRMAGDLATQRLWRLAFSAPLEPQPVVGAHVRVRELICAVLQVDSIDPKYFPRRPAPIETIKRAIVVCGLDSLRGILATAMLQPVFRASRTNFLRLPRMLWERTERAARAAELYAAHAHPQDRSRSRRHKRGWTSLSVAQCLRFRTEPVN